MAVGSRKPPTQARSKETVERLLDATARILETRGYSGLTTNHVAAEARVSIGSLYRWFDDKAELVEALRGRASDQILEQLSAVLIETTSWPVREGIERVLSTLVAQIEDHRAVLQALLSEAPMGSHQNLLPEIERRLAAHVRVFVLRHAPDLAERERETRIHLALGLTLDACLRMVFDRPEVVDPDRLLEMTADLLALGIAVPGPSPEGDLSR